MNEQPGNGRNQAEEETQDDVVDAAFARALTTIQAARGRLKHDIVEVANLIATCFAKGGKLLVCGNGGSAADAQHFVAELVGRYRVEGRRALPAIALTADTAVLTAWSNDGGYENVFARQVEALGRAGDLLFVISTSGQSPNLLAALLQAEEMDMGSVALLGAGGGEARKLADWSLVVPARDTPRIQEVHILILHLLSELIEADVISRDRWVVRETPVTRNGNRP